MCAKCRLCGQCSVRCTSLLCVVCVGFVASLWLGVPFLTMCVSCRLLWPDFGEVYFSLPCVFSVGSVASLL